MISRFLTISALLMANSFGQSADITGWTDLQWGATRPVAAKALQELGGQDCTLARNSSCAEAPGADVLVIEKYNFNRVPFRVSLLFTSKNGLSKVILTAEDKPDAFEKILSELTARYGRPGLQSEYDDEERAHSTWIWLKVHGKLSLESEEGSGVFTLTYEARR